MKDESTEMQFLINEAARYHYRRPFKGECEWDYGHEIGSQIDHFDFEESRQFFKKWNWIKNKIKEDQCKTTQS